MSVTIELEPEVEDRIKRQAIEKGISAEDYIAFLLYESLEIPEDKRNGIKVRFN